MIGENKDKALQVMAVCAATVQADILKEDQAQNTCIYTLDFSLKLMGDVQEFFCIKLKIIIPFLFLVTILLRLVRTQLVRWHLLLLMALLI